MSSKSGETTTSLALSTALTPPAAPVPADPAPLTTVLRDTGHSYCEDGWADAHHASTMRGTRLLYCRHRWSQGAAQMPRRAAGTAVDVDVDVAGAVDDVEQTVRAIGPRLKALRAELGLSLQQMSVIADVSAASIHKIE